MSIKIIARRKDDGLGTVVEEAQEKELVKCIFLDNGDSISLTVVNSASIGQKVALYSLQKCEKLKENGKVLGRAAKEIMKGELVDPRSMIIPVCRGKTIPIVYESLPAIGIISQITFDFNIDEISPYDNIWVLSNEYRERRKFH